MYVRSSSNIGMNIQYLTRSACLSTKHIEKYDVLREHFNSIIVRCYAPHTVTPSGYDVCIHTYNILCHKSIACSQYACCIICAENILQALVLGIAYTILILGKRLSKLLYLFSKVEIIDNSELC